MIFPWNFRRSSNEIHLVPESVGFIISDVKSHRNPIEIPGLVNVYSSLWKDPPCYVAGGKSTISTGQVLMFLLFLPEGNPHDVPLVGWIAPCRPQQAAGPLGRRALMREENSGSVWAPAARCAAALCGFVFSIPQLLRESLVLSCNLCGST